MLPDAVEPPAEVLAAAPTVRPILPEYGVGPGTFQLIRLAGPPVTPTWHKQPKIWVGIWINPNLSPILDASGVSLADRIREFHTYLYPLCSICFYETDYEAATTRYHHADQTMCMHYSRSFRNMSGGYASSLFAVNTINDRDIWICDRNKAAFGNTKRHGLGLVRTIGHAWFVSKGWPEQGFPSDAFHLPKNASRQGYRNPHQSAPIYWPATAAGLARHGRGGCDTVERTWLVQYARSLGGGDGSAWLWRHDRGHD